MRRFPQEVQGCHHWFSAPFRLSGQNCRKADDIIAPAPALAGSAPSRRTPDHQRRRRPARNHGPSGGYKGAGIALMTEMTAAALIGANLEIQASCGAGRTNFRRRTKVRAAMGAADPGGCGRRGARERGENRPLSRWTCSEGNPPGPVQPRNLPIWTDWRRLFPLRPSIFFLPASPRWRI